MALIIDDLLRFPIDLSVKIISAIRDMADEQMLNTQDAIQKRFMEIQMLYENGELEENKYREQAGFLEERLKERTGDDSESR